MKTILTLLLILPLGGCVHWWPTGTDYWNDSAREITEPATAAAVMVALAGAALVALVVAEGLAAAGAAVASEWE